MEIPCSEKSAKSETSNFGLCFFLNAASKKRKIRILELWLTDSRSGHNNQAAAAAAAVSNF